MPEVGTIGVRRTAALLGGVWPPLREMRYFAGRVVNSKSRSHRAVSREMASESCCCLFISLGTLRVGQASLNAH